MKANEAPEKIYLVEDRQKHEPMEYWYNSTTDDSKIEYVRTDAFIKKACLWLEDNIDRYLYNTGVYEEYIPKCGGKMFEDFKKAMEK